MAGSGEIDTLKSACDTAAAAGPVRARGKRGAWPEVSTAGWIVIVCLVGWLLLQRSAIRRLRSDLEETRRDMYRAKYDADEQLHGLQTDLSHARLELRHRAGDLAVAPHTTLQAALERHPRVAEFFAAYHIGGSSGPAATSQETLAQTALTYGLDLEKLLTELTRLLEAPEVWVPPMSPDAPPQSSAFEV